MDFIYERMNDDTEMNQEDMPKSEIQQFFSGKTIFFTGCTGYMGKCLVEKLLRTCSDLKRLYILVRIKKYESIEKRAEDYFNNVVFDRLRNLRPNFKEQVTVIAGDLALPGMAISSEDRLLLTETVDVIIHNAAMVIFTARLNMLLRVNVLGTKEMLDLAMECRNLECFLYVSTAYSHCYLKTIEEKFYKSPADLKIVYDMIKADTETESGLSKEVLKSFMDPLPNPYIFTKAIAESIVQDYAKKAPFPCGIFRMSIAISTYKEPVRSWCGNINGPSFQFLAIGLGILHVIYCMKNYKLDFIPADMTANACLVATWDLVKNKKDRKEGCVYNYASIQSNLITYDILKGKALNFCKRFPSIKMVGVIFIFIVNNYYFFLLSHILLHYIPAVIVDLLRLVQLKKAKYIPMLLRIEKHVKGTIYFAEHNWDIKLGEFTRLWDEMKPADHANFFCDLRKLDWDEYSKTYWFGMRAYLLNEQMDNVEAARFRFRIIYIATYTILTLIALFVGYVVFNKISSIFV